MAEVHQRSRGAYGSRRVHAELRLGRGIVSAIGRPSWKHAKTDQIATDRIVNSTPIRDLARFA
ncbi:hypothetical protein [Nocardia sp. NPDC059239]|uniref:hypothetical protein n=1 Tax=Nocardia sp. NPDC059239 TaxID=3346785 RepID=UPI00369412C2